MITVISIILILVALAVPATNSLLRANDLTQGSQNLINQLGLARQQALTQNHPVEVRFYQYADPNNPGEFASNVATWKFRAMQTFSISEAGIATPVNKVEHFPPTFIIDAGKTSSTDTTLSSILAPPSGAPTGIVLTSAPQTYTLPTIGTNYNSVAFRFYPDGSTNLGPPPPPSTNGWFLTAHLSQYGDNLTKPPHNFATLQVDPANGNLREFRP